MSECAICNGWGVDETTGFTCSSCGTVKQSLTVEPVRSPEELGAAMQTDAEPVAWMYTDEDEVQPFVHVQLDRATKGEQPYCTETPLYAHPPVDDREAIIAAKDAEIAALKGKLAEQAEDNADLPTIAYFAGAADARDRLTALQAHADAMAEALGEVMEWIAGWTPDFTQDAEWPDTREKVSLARRAYEEFRR